MPRFLLTMLLTGALLCGQLAAPPMAQALYVLGFGDTITVTVKDAPQYSFGGPMRPDGVVNIPFVGEVEVAGLTPTQAADRIELALRAVLRNPQVSVTVTSYKTPVVTFLGQVRSPGVLTLNRHNPTLFDAIAQAGGFTERAVPAEVIVIRGDGPDAQRIVIDVEQMMRTGDFSQNIPVQTGDKIQVKEVWWPDWAALRADLTIFASLIATVAVLLTWYDRASQPQ